MRQKAARAIKTTAGDKMAAPATSVRLSVGDQLREIKRISAEGVVVRVEDWKERLEKLVNTISEWGRELAGDYEQKRYTVRQFNEMLLEKHHVAPAELPAISLTKGKHVATFEPNVLWIIGANGRVSVFSDMEPYTLVDMGGLHGEPSDWQVVGWKLERTLIPFDREAFKKILGNQPL